MIGLQRLYRRFVLGRPTPVRGAGHGRMQSGPTRVAPGDGMSPWVPVAVGAGLVAVLGLLFVHIFMILILGVTAVALGVWLAQRVMGPDVRIGLALPPGLKARFGAMWGRLFRFGRPPK